ncbi:MAG: sugar phosphate isomerase/epimerase [Lachnospiraceae bacterium]|nr:sugar phosphate isomerase/epimerase [Lachnospiraceae bacterium]
MALKHLGATGHAFKDDTFQKVAEKLKRNNIDRIQLTPGKITTEFDWTKNCYTPALANYIREKLEGIHLSSLGCYINMAADGNAEVERFNKNIEFTKYVGADLICTETGKRDTLEETRSAENYHRVLENGKKMAACAEKHGVTIGLEICRPHSIWNIELFKQFLDAIDSPNLCCVFDLVGFLNSENIDQQHELMDLYFDLLRDKIRLVHLKDMDIVDGRKTIVPVGTGRIDFEYLFKKIDENICAVDMIVESVNPEYIMNGLDYFKRYR